MSNGDKIGLLPGFGWLADGPWWWILIKCWVITPGAMIVIAPLFEGRMLPLGPERQFLSFIPGDFILGMSVATLLVMASNLPSERRWYNSVLFHGIVLLITMTVAVVMTLMEYRAGVYSLRAIMSPTKLYHNFTLYAGYGYIVVVTLVAVVVAARSWLLAPGIALLVVWVALVVNDNFLSEVDQKSKSSGAHIGNWRPFWER